MEHLHRGGSTRHEDRRFRGRLSPQAAATTSRDSTGPSHRRIDQDMACAPRVLRVPKGAPMSSNGDRRQLLEHYGRCYAEHGLAVVWTRGLNGDDAKAVTASAWQTTQPLSEAEFAAGLFATRGLRANPAIAARTSGLVLIDCDTPEGLAEIEALGLPSTVTVQSSAPHKRHFWFKAPLGARRLPKVGFRFEAGGFSADAN